MTRTRRRLAIAVAPRLLGDALSRVLACENRDVTVILTDPYEGGGHDHVGTAPFDIAVVSHDGGDIQASVVIRLPDTPMAGTARVGGERVRIDDLAGLVALVERCAAALDVGVAPPVDTGI